MKTEKNMFIAFILNLSFSIFEIVGGFISGSISIISDALHDLGDATCIGIAIIFEKKSKRCADNLSTYGYARYSVISSAFMFIIMIISSIFVLYNAIYRIVYPIAINYQSMIIFAIIGTVTNLFASLITQKGNSLNQKAVNLHMLEDCLGWVAILIGAIVIKFTNFILIDAIISVIIAVFILINATKSLKRAIDVFCEKVPNGVDLEGVINKLNEVDGVKNVHHLHVWSLDGYKHLATLHAVIYNMEDSAEIKEKIKHILLHENIVHATIETEKENDTCLDKVCKIESIPTDSHTHSHHHHH